MASGEAEALLLSASVAPLYRSDSLPKGHSNYFSDSLSRTVLRLPRRLAPGYSVNKGIRKEGAGP